jgi:membrane associated rhomboid family serine protease
MRYYQTSIGFGHPWTPVVKRLIIASAVVFLLQIFWRGGMLEYLFGLNTDLVFGRLMVWQLATYLFLHGGAFHLLFNMLALWMFGSELEGYLGSREFTLYYLLTGVGAGLAVTGVDLLTGRPGLTVGASGAVFGLLAAYGLIWGRRPITLLVLFIFPVTMEARIFVILFAAAELLLGIEGSSRIAHFAHLGGMLVGWAYFRLLRGSLKAGGWGLTPWRRLLERFIARRAMDDQERLDQILDKINRYGIHTLTRGERDFLQKMSSRRN